MSEPRRFGQKPQQQPCLRTGNGGYSLSTSQPAQGWSRIADVPATTSDHKRVGVSVGTTASVELPGGGGSALAFAGGFSHTNCSKEAFLMRKAGGNVSYTRLPSLPWDIAEAGIVAVGSRIFSIGGSDCGLPPNTERFLTWCDRWGRNEGFGKRVLLLDLEDCPRLLSGSASSVDDEACEWKKQPDMPGTPRSGGTLAAVGTTIYLLGGATSGNSSHAVPPSKKPCKTIKQPGCGASVSDNWKLDTSSMKWTQVITSACKRPVSQPCAFVFTPNGAVSQLPSPVNYPVGNTKGFGLWRGRYIVSVGVGQRGRSLSFPSDKFETIATDSPLNSRLNDTCSPPQTGWGNNSYHNSISVFDTKTETFGLVTSSSTKEPGLVVPGCPMGLPLNCYSPAVGLVGDAMFVSGGECDPHHVSSSPAKTYWHYPKIALHGALSEAQSR